VRFIDSFLVVALSVLTGNCFAQNCNIRVTGIQFGNYDFLSGSAVETEADVFVTCDPEVAYLIRLDAGANSGGSFNPRRLAMAGGAASLAYNIFRDPARREIWGDGSDGTFAHRGAGTGMESHFIGYGRLPGNQNVPAGVYSDVVTVLVEW